MPEASYHCGHTGCRCMLNQNDGEFCSDYCRHTATSGPPRIEPQCECGHPECRDA